MINIKNISFRGNLKSHFASTPNFINTWNDKKRPMQGKLFIELFLFIFMVEDNFLWTEIQRKKTGRSDHFPQGTGFTSWFFRMSACTKLKSPFYNSSHKKKKKNFKWKSQNLAFSKGFINTQGILKYKCS